MAPAPVVTPESRPLPPVTRPMSSTSSASTAANVPMTPDKKSDLITRVKFTNTLPDLPFDPKFVSYPFDENRFVVYSTTSLEKNFKHEILTEPDLGVDVELVVPNAYHVPPNSILLQLDPKDDRLLEEELQPQKNQKRSMHHSRNVSWLRRTEYISTEQTRFQPQLIDKVEAKVGYSIKKKLKDEWHYSDRDSQIKAIEKTFEDSSTPITKHFSKPGVAPVEVLPIFPDFKLWKYPCAQVVFDSDPAPVGRSSSVQIEEMSQAMIRGVMDESGEQFVAYFLPTEETLAKRRGDVDANREYQEDETYEYRMAREYNWNVKSKATKGYEENYFFVIRDDGVYYNELETRVRLNKRRTRGPNQQLNTRLCVKHTELTQSDYKFQRARERDLEPIGEDDEDDEEDKSDDDKKDTESFKKDIDGEENEKDSEHEKDEKSEDEVKSDNDSENEKKIIKSKTIKKESSGSSGSSSAGSDSESDDGKGKSSKSVSSHGSEDSDL